MLTDGSMYYSEMGDELKKFNTLDGKGIGKLKNTNIKTAIITSENTKIVERRAKKLKIDYLYQNIENKLSVANEICKKENILLDEVAFIGDDDGDLGLLKKVGLPACPKNAVDKVKNIFNITILEKKGERVL